MAKAIEINDSNFDQEVSEYSGVVLLDFSAEWCGPCKRLAPTINELATEYEGKARIAHLDVDNARQTASKFGIMSVPTIIIFKNGDEVGRSIGLVPKQNLVDQLDAALG